VYGVFSTFKHINFAKIFLPPINLLLINRVEL
jgi:hypothetical protein